VPGLTKLWPHALTLLVIGLPLFGLSLAPFRKTLIQDENSPSS
jgi:hypothetical protein